jgi:mannose-6-phosphate isomerase-like protein (cupin superfamily)
MTAPLMPQAWLRTAALPLAIAMAGAIPMAALAQEELATSARDLAAAVASPGAGPKTKVIRSDPSSMILTVARTRAGDAELHERMADFFVVQQGSAEVLVGGRSSGNRKVSPGEWMGGIIEGGRIHRLGPGDTLWIPAGVPHQVRAISTEVFRYLVVKIATPHDAPPSQSTEIPLPSKP